MRSKIEAVLATTPEMTLSFREILSVEERLIADLEKTEESTLIIKSEVASRSMEEKLELPLMKRG